MTWRNNNQETRFVESGPIRGHFIVATAGGDMPWTYWIEVHKQQGDGNYRQILRYRGHTRYNDGNPLAVVDSEMPETLRRLGLWKSGDPLPVPPKLPGRCTSLYMQQDVEWCR